MSQVSRIQVINREGWSKECRLDGRIIYIGAGTDNDVSVRGNSDLIEQRHLMVRPSTQNPYGYALFNLSGKPIHHYKTGAAGIAGAAYLIASNSASELLHGDRIVFADHELTYFVGDHTSPMFSLGIHVDQTKLAPKEPLSGYITIKNTGPENAAQFEVNVDGLPANCIKKEAGPLLFSGVEKTVTFALSHPEAPKPTAGRAHPISFHITADNAYPGERATIVQMIEIMPYHAHALRLVDFLAGTTVHD